MFRICAAKNCNNSFETGRTPRRFCNPKCWESKAKARYLLNIDGQIAPHSVKCWWCEEIFETRDLRRRYCSDAHRRIGRVLGQVRRYGITKDQYRDMWIAQNGLCAVCNQPERSIRNELLAVDHDHETGRVRGLLCSHCNIAIGLFGDDIEALRRAAEYLTA